MAELNLPGWVEFANAKVVTERDQQVRIFFANRERSRLPLKCPCGRAECATDWRLEGWRRLTVVDTPDRDRLATRLTIKRRLYRCARCDARIGEDLSDIVALPRRITRRAVEFVRYEVANSSFIKVGRDLALPDTTIRNIFMQTPAVPSGLVLPPLRYLGVDETDLRDIGEHTPHFRTVLVNLETGRVVDILPDKRNKTLEHWFHRLERAHEIRAVAMDFAPGYRSVVNNMLPLARVVIDSFHVAKETQLAVDRVRDAEVRAKRNANGDSKKKHRSETAAKIAARRQAKSKSETKYDQREIRRLQRTVPEQLNERERFLLEGFHQRHPKSEQAYQEAHKLKKIWANPEIDNELAAMIAFRRWHRSLPEAFQGAFEELTKKIYNASAAAFEFFNFRISNAETECRHGHIKRAKAHNVGEISFETLRLKVLAEAAGRGKANHFICAQCGDKRPVAERCVSECTIEAGVCLVFHKDPNDEILLCRKCNELVSKLRKKHDGILHRTMSPPEKRPSLAYRLSPNDFAICISDVEPWEHCDGLLDREGCPNNLQQPAKPAPGRWMQPGIDLDGR